MTFRSLGTGARQLYPPRSAKPPAGYFGFVPTSSPPANPDDLPIHEAFRQAGAEEHIAYTAAQRIRDVAAANLIARFEAKLDAKFDAQTAELAALKDQLRRERTMLWAVIALLGAAVMHYLLVG